MTNTIMLIHGAWLNAKSWENFKTHYEARGFNVIAPNWPYDDRDPEVLRSAPDPRLAAVGVGGIVDSFEIEIRKLKEPPILIGHSAGAVFVQILLDRGLGASGVAINPAPTTGVRLGRHAIVSALPVLGSWGSWRRVMHMSRKFFADRFANTLPRDLVDYYYDRFVVPTAGKVYWDGILTSVGKIHWDNPNRAPLLLIGGGIDLIADATMTKAIYLKQKRAGSDTALKIFEERSHFTCIDPGWEEVADYALDWAVRHAQPASSQQSEKLVPDAA
ncbi:alpha/beta hydrolase [Rhizobium rhizophilum]|uniref:Alpha/beta hydrolase n=1 Tax=Rhizobium rhizophilum TaxID=1850373 RepID=A0ABY2QRP5_9HYPH|nr:alpha/beta hydrolase [Rhizobium rhizophilum]THV12688.1 alpha/beta hydrolase [Rhizobium rhizophilum]